MKKRSLVALLLCLALLVCGCGGKAEPAATEPAASGANAPSAGDAAPAEPENPYASMATAIMLPGIEGENPIFQMLVRGIKKACAELGAPEPKVVEGGDQWTAYGKYLTSLAESGLYDILFTCTAVMNYCVKDTSATYPDQKIVLLDADILGYAAKYPEGKLPDNVWGVSFDLYQLGYLGGYFAGLITQSAMPRANAEHVVGLVFTDVYDPWEIDTKTGFINGARAACPDVEVLNSIVGDWVDPQKAADVTRALFTQGADVVYYTGGASTYGCVTEAAAQRKYAIANDNNAISLDPETIPGCSMILGEDAAYKYALMALKDELPWGTGEAIGAADGVISFTFDDPSYLEKVPQDIRDKMTAAFEGLVNGTIDAHAPIS